MFRSDAEEALNVYRHFCKETEHVVEYLGVAKKLQNILNVPIPNLRHVRIHSTPLHLCILKYVPGTGLPGGCPRGVLERSEF